MDAKRLLVQCAVLRWGWSLLVIHALRTARLASTVSVVIPCYNAAPFLEETLRSVLAQTHAPHEIIVVDDGSTDGSAAVAAAFGPKVTVIRQKNHGESAARNRAIEQAHGEWIAFLDADDVWQPHKLERQLDRAGDDTVAVHCNYFHFGGDDRIVDVSTTPPEVLYRLEHLAGSTPILLSSLMVRRALPIRFEEWAHLGEDLLYTLDLTLQGPIALVPEPLAGYRVHPGSQSRRRTVEIQWQESIEGWLARRGDRCPAEAIPGIRRAGVELVSWAARAAKWERRWDDYWTLRRHLAAYAEWSEARRVLSERILPPWLYWVRDRLSVRRHGRARA